MEKIINMPEENISMVVWQGEIHMCNLPSLKQLVTTSHEELVRVLRFCPISPQYGYTEAQLSELTISRNDAKDELIELVR